MFVLADIFENTASNEPVSEICFWGPHIIPGAVIMITHNGKAFWVCARRLYLDRKTFNGDIPEVT